VNKMMFVSVCKSEAAIANHYTIQEQTQLIPENVSTFPIEWKGAALEMAWWTECRHLACRSGYYIMGSSARV
jgi:hypothetical protein